jgi:ABC-type lipoprotein release transport system permease subunit
MPKHPQRDPLFPRYLTFLSARYLLSRPSGLAAVLAVTFGVSIILITLSIMGGYIDELERIIQGQESHIIITGARAYDVTDLPDVERTILAHPNVAAASPYVETLAMYRSAQFNPCHLRGIVPGTEPLVTAVGRYTLRPAELDLILERLGVEEEKKDEASASSLDWRQEPEAIGFIHGIQMARGRAPLSPEEFASLFSAERRREVLQTRNPEVLADLGGKLPPAAIVGIQLLLGREVFLGQVVTLATIAPGGYEPVQRKFVVTGAFRSGDFDADKQILYANVDVIKNMLGLASLETGSRYEGIRVAVKDPSLVHETRVELARALAPEHGQLTVMPWDRIPRQRNLLRAVESEKVLIYFLLIVLMAFTCCMVLLMLLLTVIEKTRDMGVLLALGATPGGVVRIFLANGAVLSVAGVALGLGAGYLFCSFINPIHDWIYLRTGVRLFPAEIYHMDRIPIAFRLADALSSVAPAIVLGFLASLAPAIWASRRDPIKAIHYE